MFCNLSDIDECSTEPCVNGDCSDSVDSYTCSCHNGYTGNNCETGELLLSQPQTGWEADCS